MIDNIYDYIKQEESSYDSEQVTVGENWDWNMQEHIQMLFHLYHGQYFKGDNDFLRPFKKIMKTIVGLANWTEDIEVKDVDFFIEGSADRALTFLIKKYHDEVYTREHDIDELFDEITQNDNQFGGVLVQPGAKRPESVPLVRIAFANQSNILGGAYGLKYNFSPSDLLQMKANGWGEESNGATISIEDLITMSDNTREASGLSDKKEDRTTGKNIEVYLVKGDLPSHYLNDDDDLDTQVYQMQIVAFYTDKESNKHGVCLYRKKANTRDKFFTSEPIENRGLGGSVAEDMLHPQIWTNFLEIHKTQMLESGAKTPLVTDDQSFRTKNKVQDMENLEITTIREGASINLIPTINGNNVALYDNAISEWLNQAQLSGSAFDPILGKEQNAGTTFRGQERTVAQGRGSHDRKRGKRAKFIEEIYRDYIIPDIKKQIVKGQEFLATLDAEELSWVADQMATRALNNKIKEKLFKMEIMSPEEQEKFRNDFRATFMKAGNKKLIEILKDEFKGIEMRIGINIANKQKNLADLSDKVLSIFQFIFQQEAQAPGSFAQAMQNTGLSKAFSSILEFSGLSLGDFSAVLQAQPQLQAQNAQQQPQQGQASPLNNLVTEQQNG